MTEQKFEIFREFQLLSPFPSMHSEWTEGSKHAWPGFLLSLNFQKITKELPLDLHVDLGFHG